VVTVPILDFIWGKKLLRCQIIGACLAAFGVFALELGGQQTTITDGDGMSLIQPVGELHAYLITYHSPVSISHSL
jgi:hypothetical protein